LVIRNCFAVAPGARNSNFPPAGRGKYDSKRKPFRWSNQNTPGGTGEIIGPGLWGIPVSRGLPGGLGTCKNNIPPKPRLVLYRLPAVPPPQVSPRQFNSYNSGESPLSPPPPFGPQPFTLAPPPPPPRKPKGRIQWRGLNLFSPDRVFFDG